jgi:threonine/homoserine efflux transporter RhtA
MHPIEQIGLHFATSATAGLIVYILATKAVKTKNKQAERMAFALALFAAILIHIIIDYQLEWF